MLIVLTWGATAALTALVGEGRDVFEEDCLCVDVRVDGLLVVDLLDEDLLDEELEKIVFLDGIVYD